MSLQADWFTAAVTTDHTDDPFAGSTMSSSPATLSIESSEEELFERIKRLLKREERLWQRGITCPLKDERACKCSACPINKRDDPVAELSALCRIGEEQDRAEMTILAKRVEI